MTEGSTLGETHISLFFPQEHSPEFLMDGGDRGWRSGLPGWLKTEYGGVSGKRESYGKESPQICTYLPPSLELTPDLGRHRAGPQGAPEESSRACTEQVSQQPPSAADAGFGVPVLPSAKTPQLLCQRAEGPSPRSRACASTQGCSLGEWKRRKRPILTKLNIKSPQDRDFLPVINCLTAHY